MLAKKLLLLILLLPYSVLVAENKVSKESILSDQYLDTGEWHISIAIGAGKRTNPLVGGDKQPLYILPDIAYYGAQFYFDNGDLGYTFSETKNYSFGLLTHLNYEKSYFSYIHPANILFPASYINGINPITPEDLENRPSVHTISTRKYALDLGFDLNMYVTEHGLFRFQLMKDHLLPFLFNC